MDWAPGLDARRSAGLLRQLHPVDGPQGPEITYRGRSVINLASNNYLGLADHPAVLAAARNALDTDGFGAGAARLISGNHRIFSELEAALADLKGCPAALLFGTGYMANVGLLQALAITGSDDSVTIYGDRLNHASLVDGARLARATLRIYPHRDVAALEKRLTRDRERRPEGDSGSRIIATDGVFSMDGDVAPLEQLARVATDAGATLVVDDAHGTGVLGNGRGSVHAAGLGMAQVPVQMGTLGKALGTYGAFVAGSRDLIDHLINHAHSFIYTTAPPPPVAAAALAAVTLCQGDTGRARRQQLAENLRYFAAGLVERGLRSASAAPPSTPIFPVHVGNATHAARCADDLLTAGVLAPCVRPPTVPRGTSRLRLTVTAGHSRAHLDRALAALEGLEALGTGVTTAEGG